LSGTAASRAFARHEDFVKVFGPAGSERQWHHIVEQNAANIEKFGAAAIHNPSNYVNITDKAHQQITAHYNSKGISGALVREEVSKLSYEMQRHYGLQVLKGVLLSEQIGKGIEVTSKWIKALTSK
jgi:hypothetical protein